MSTLERGNRRARAAIIVVGILGSVTSLSGCQSYNAIPSQMVPQDVPRATRLGETGCVHATLGTLQGGSVSRGGLFGRNTMVEMNIAIGDFAKAVELTLTETGLFDQIVRCDANPQYRLEVTLLHQASLAAPTAFHTTPALVVAQWKLVQTRENRTIWEERVDSDFVLPPTTSFYRSRKAVEGAARDNIKQAMTRLIQLAKPSPADGTMTQTVN